MSAVDGFAVHPRDVAAASECRPVRLQITGTIHAGDSAKIDLRPGTAIKIMTGACVPRGAGAMVMKEYCREAAAAVIVGRTVRAGENVRPRGGEFRKGQKVLPPGVSITPPVAGLLATFGYASVFVYEQPAVTIVVTGDELLSPSQRLRPGKIRDGNSYALVAAVQALGIEQYRATRLKDRPAVLKRHLADALKRSDMLLVVGGMSVGDRDYVRTVLSELGVKEHFWRMAVKPGKPAYFGRFDRPGGVRASGSRLRRRRPCLVFGLPGNPVSALVCFHQLVKPALLRMMGLSPAPPLAMRARLVGERRKQPGRLEWLRGILSGHDGGLWVEPTSGQDSHMLGGLARANCLIQFPQAADGLADGAEVIVELLSWRE
jgi:molybdopterin molybdotransferase